MVIGTFAVASFFLVAPPSEAKEDSPSLVRQIGADFKNVFTTEENLVIVGAGLGGAWAASHFDQEIAASGLNSELNGGAALDGLFEAGESLGGSLVQVGGAFATLGLGKLTSKPKLERLGRDLVRAQVVTQTLTAGVKLAVGRERPDGSNQASFPSGHASGAFATATVLQRHFGWKVGVPVYAVAGYIATSRLNESKHYLSDIVFGAALGILGGRTVTVELAKARFALHPTVSSTAVGIELTWIGPADGFD